ncbi:MAG: proton-conducting transporter membrane subunit, partial [Mycobacteriaceae bacterium]
MSALLALLVALPALVGFGLLAAPVLGSRGERAAGPLAVVTTGLVLATAVLVTLARPSLTVTFLPGLASGLAVDGLSAALVLTVSVAALVVVVFTTGSPESGRRRLFGLLLLFTAAMLVVVTATDLVALLAGWELMGLTSYALIGHGWREPARVDAGVTAFLTTRLADVGLYVAVGAGLALGSTGLGALDGGSGWARVAAVGVAVAALGKSAQLPFSGWLSGAMLGPSPASALLHSATMVAAGGYLLLRLHPLLAATGIDTAVAWVGAVTAVVMGAVAMTQHDLKQLLAASTCAQIGFVVLAAGTGSINGGVLALIAHAATKALLFLCAGAWLDALGTKNLTALRGVGRRYPVVGRAPAGQPADLCRADA